jgi:predicted secreted Zn-dependent protease
MVTILALALALSNGAGGDSSGSASAGGIPVVINEKLVRYEIKGDTSSELIAQMARLGPMDGNEHRRFQGHTAWAVRWSYNFAGETSGLCRLQDIEVQLEVLMTLPDWRPRRHADQRLVQAWPHYLANLTGHEMGHRANGVRAAFAVRDALAGVDPAADCRQLGEVAGAAARDALALHQGADAEYDRETSHGAKSGFRLP